MDGLSVAASVAGLVSLGIQVTQGLIAFYLASKDRKSDLAHTIAKLQRLLADLEHIRGQLKRRKFRPDEHNLLDSIEDHIHACDEDIKELQTEVEKLSNVSTNGARKTARQLMYPFKQSTLQKLEEDIDEVVSHLGLALKILGQNDVRHIQDEVERTQELMRLVRVDQVDDKIRKWLNAPDASSNYNQAFQKWHPGTGRWFVEGRCFATWLTRTNSFLWLHGFAGCGKSVLCSTVIRHTFRHRRCDKRIGIAFFFFMFNNESKQDISAMLRALILQLSSQGKGKHEYLSKLYAKYSSGTAPNQALMDCLHQLVREFDEVYILLDALDESPRGRHRRDTLQGLAEMRAWAEPGLHILVTSREEVDIRDELDAAEDEIVLLKNESIDRDIAEFTSKHLRENRRLRRWEKYHDQIETVLIQGAKGVFRWVECQFTALESFSGSKRSLDTMLGSLPPTLDQTYERMLLNINEESVEDARRLLALLCCAKRPLSVAEVIEGIAVELGDNPRLNPDARLFDQDEVRRLCPGLLELDEDFGEDDSDNGLSRDSKTKVRLAHFSVQEYLECDRMDNTAVARFRVRPPDAHAENAAICLTYLLEPGLSLLGSRAKFPFLLYAAQNWIEHFRNGDKRLHQAGSQALRLFRDARHAFETWVSIWDPDGWSGPRSEEPSVYYASLLGLDSILSELLQDRTPESNSFLLSTSETRPDVNARGGQYGTPLCAASAFGNEAAVRLLLEKGADINAQAGYMGEPVNALIVAVSSGHQGVIRLLLENGADIDAHAGIGGTALTAAASSGHNSIVRLLLENSNAPSLPTLDSLNGALQTALLNNNVPIARLLLEQGATIDQRGLCDSTALHFASHRGDETLVQLLLDYGAEVNAQDYFQQTALQLASRNSHKAVVQLLLERGATDATEVTEVTEVTKVKS